MHMFIQLNVYYYHIFHVIQLDEYVFKCWYMHLMTIIWIYVMNEDEASQTSKSIISWYPNSSSFEWIENIRSFSVMQWMFDFEIKPSFITLQKQIEIKELI